MMETIKKMSNYFIICKEFSNGNFNRHKIEIPNYITTEQDAIEYFETIVLDEFDNPEMVQVETVYFK